MGARTFMDFISVDEIQRQSGAITEVQDVISMKDFMKVFQYNDSLLIYFGCLCCLFILYALSVFKPPGWASRLSRRSGKRLEVSVSRGLVTEYYQGEYQIRNDRFCCSTSKERAVVGTTHLFSFLQTAALSEVRAYLLLYGNYNETVFPIFIKPVNVQQIQKILSHMLL